MARPMGVDTWCSQKHVATAEGHFEEVLTKLYRESPDSDLIPEIQNQILNIQDLREDIVNNLGSMSEHELGFDKGSCDRCVDDFNIKLDEDEIVDSVADLGVKEGSFDTPLRKSNTTQVLNILGYKNQSMAKKNMTDEMKNVGIVNASQVLGLLASGLGKKLDTYGKSFLGKKLSFWSDVVLGLGLQGVAVASDKEALKIAGLVSGSQILSNVYRPYLTPGAQPQQFNYSPRSEALKIVARQEKKLEEQKKPKDEMSLIQVD